MFASLCKFFSRFKNPTRTAKASSRYPTSEEIAKSVEAFKNRTIHKILTSEIIDRTSNDKLVLVVLDNISEKLPKDDAKEHAAVLELSEPRQAIHVIWNLDAEINNGGFNQFYANSSGQYAPLLPSALKLIGATRHHLLMIQANNTYRREFNKITEHLDGTIEGFVKSYDNNPLTEFDAKYYKLEVEENLQKLMVDFIRKNKAAFIDE